MHARIRNAKFRERAASPLATEEETHDQISQPCSLNDFASDCTLLPVTRYCIAIHFCLFSFICFAWCFDNKKGLLGNSFIWEPCNKSLNIYLSFSLPLSLLLSPPSFSPCGCRPLGWLCSVSVRSAGGRRSRGTHSCRSSCCCLQWWVRISSSANAT